MTAALVLEWKRAWVAYAGDDMLVVCQLRRGFYDCYLNGKCVDAGMSVEEAKDRLAGKLSQSG